MRRASEGSGPPGGGIQGIQQEYQQLQRLASPSHSPVSIPGSPVHERGVAAITQGKNDKVSLSNTSNPKGTMLLFKVIPFLKF